MDDSGIPNLAKKLDHLFKTVPAPTKSGRYSNDAAAAALQEAGVSVTGVHISHLRSGRRDNPSARLLAALAGLFHVPIAYFFDEAREEQITAELEALVAFNDERVRNLMLRAQGLSAQSMNVVEGVVERIRQLEHLNVGEAKPQ